MATAPQLAPQDLCRGEGGAVAMAKGGQAPSLPRSKQSSRESGTGTELQTPLASAAGALAA